MQPSIVTSVEAHFGIPGQIEQQALSYLDDDLRYVVQQFRERFEASPGEKVR